MKKTRWAVIATIILAGNYAFAGGLLTNSNQSINFLRNPARDAVIAIDGVYSNPAGVAFMTEGFHLGLNIQNAHQTRTIVSAYGPLFNFNANNPAPIGSDGLAARKFKGKADAPVIPSIHAAYNKNRWSFQFGFGLIGGGGKCEFENGLGSFEGIVASQIVPLAQNTTLQSALAPMGIALTGRYDYNSYMKGRQYYFGFMLGSAYKVTDNLSVYGGVRLLYGTASYIGMVKDISIEQVSLQTGNRQLVPASMFFSSIGQQQAAFAAQDIEINCDQKGVGIAPIIGVDYRLGKLNLAAKYEFKTRMRLKNDSHNSSSADALPALARFKDGNKVAEDSPALLTIGAQYALLPSLRLSAGYHHYFDVDTKQFTKSMLSDTNEYLFGAEYDITKRLQVSAGWQKTNYELNDEGMNDISFNTCSYSFGFGLGLKVKENIKVNAAYFQTNYSHYNKEQVLSNIRVTDDFTRTNRVIGIGVELDF